MKLTDFTQGYVSRLRKVEEQLLEKYRLVLKKAHHYNVLARDWVIDPRNIAQLSHYGDRERYEEMHDKYWTPGPPGHDWNGKWKDEYVFTVTIPVAESHNIYTGKLDKQKLAGKTTARLNWTKVVILRTQIKPSEMEELVQLASNSELAAKEVDANWVQLTHLRKLIKNLEKLSAQYPKHEDLLAYHEDDN